MIQLTPEQEKAYVRFITARNKVNGKKYIRHADVIETVDIAGMNHPLFTVNDDWLEYKEASQAWWKVEPAFRDQERMRSSRGDYGQADKWDEKQASVSDVYTMIKEEK